jgi:hypothetical protein
MGPMSLRDLEKSLRLRSAILWYGAGLVAILVVLVIALPRM